MRDLALVIILFTLISIINCNPVYAQVASGITNPTAANGTYTQIADQNGKSAWSHTDGTTYYIYWVTSSGGAWLLDDDLTVGNQYFFILSTADLPPSTGWSTSLGVGTLVLSNFLPVELTSFTALKLDNAVQLLWETATEVNNYGFEVQRKTDCGEDCDSNWEVLDFVPGHGNSNSPKQYEYVDDNVPSEKLLYRLKQIDTDGSFEYYNETVSVNADNITGVESDNLPGEFSLAQNYPNPFNPVTQIRFALAEKSNVILSVYNTLGEQVAELINSEYSPGEYEVEFNAENLPSGMYIYRLQAGDNYNAVRKMALVK